MAFFVFYFVYHTKPSNKDWHIWHEIFKILIFKTCPWQYCLNLQASANLLSPPMLQASRRRSSVMFSDVVLLHGENGSPTSGTSSNLSTNNVDKKNVCSSEKMTQTGLLNTVFTLSNSAVYLIFHFPYT